MDAFGLEGRFGFALIDLALVSAGISTIALFLAARRAPGLAADAWKRMGLAAFAVHATAVFATLALLLTLLITHRFEYHYVWSHSSRELPLHFVLACLWEGQEGSFLVWMVWHAVLGLAVWAWAPRSWVAPVLAVMASVQAILATMILGATVPGLAVGALLALGLLVAGAEVWRSRQQAPQLAAALLVLAGLSIAIVLSGWAGFGSISSAEGPITLQGALWLLMLYLGATAMASVIALWRRQLTLPAATAAIGVCVLTALVAAYPLEALQLGSSPFLLLREAMPTEPVFATDATFTPTNGRGLNPLLQNYWMVIHPPTLFLGFSLTLVPFAFVAGGLITGRVTEWLKPSAPWLVAAVAVLGVGILMGGYWAYETLNFGGYWNWDPVENASLVPWLTGVGALHLTLAYRHSGAHLRSAMALVIATFVLVLYSTFLVRSGVLGDASVHSFTDLGLSCQLVVLVLVYEGGICLLLWRRWPELPHAAAEAPFWSRDTFLLLAGIVLTIAALQISLTTSLPVINKLFGTRLAPSGKIQFFYYQWNVWVGIGIACLSAIGQFLFWRGGRGEWANALFRPFAAAAAAAVAGMLLLAMARWPFVYEPLLQQAESAGGVAAITTFVLRLADEVLLFTALFTVFANLDILIGLVRKKGRVLLSTGGSLAHIGFGLMLLGILFSSGYEQTVSVNFSPGELGAQFPEQERLDNVLLVQQQPKYIRDYRVVYRGQAQATAPIGTLRVLFEDANGMKLAFTDGAGERFGLELPAAFLDLPQLRQQGIVQPVAQPAADGPLSSRLDLERLRGFIQANLGLLKPQLLNGRRLYTLEFAPLDAERKLADSTRGFVLYPEAEVSEAMGLVLHPDRQVSLLSDLYVYVSSIPADQADTKPDTTTRRMQITEWRARPGGRGQRPDTLHTPRATLVLDSIVQVADDPRFAGAALVVRAKMRALAGGMVYAAEPNFILAQGGAVSHADDRIERLGIQVSFAGVNPKENHVVMQVGLEEATDDFVTIKAIRKPLINLLWLGTVVLTLGFAVAAVRRARESRAAA